MTVLLEAFLVIAGTLLMIDIMVHQEDKPITLGNAVKWSLVYVAGALAFAGIIYANSGAQMASLFLSGYIMEKALSVDNLMVFVAIFAYFGVKDEKQHKILHYGIIGAIVFRLMLVYIGANFMALFGGWTGLVFAALVFYSAVMMIRGGSDNSEPWYASYWPSLMTKPFIPCLIAIELSDVIFSFDSVPAVIAVTRDPLMIYSAMIFAILGLRSLYFILSAMLRYLCHLGTAVITVLFFIAGKLAFSSINELGALIHMPEVSPVVSLSIVIVILALGVIASILFPESETQDA